MFDYADVTSDSTLPFSLLESVFGLHSICYKRASILDENFIARGRLVARIRERSARVITVLAGVV